MKTTVCARCILDSTIPNIKFDEEGVCNYCRCYEFRNRNFPNNEQGQKRLNDLTDSIIRAGKNKRYDCIVGLSGGTDSSYALYLVVSMGLRPLAVHFDNGWNSELAVSNITKMLDILGVELYTYVVDWEEFRQLQIALLKASVPDVELLTDYGIVKTLYKTAQKFGVKYIISGDNFRTEGIIPRGWTYFDDRYFHHLFRKFSTVKIKTYPKYSMIDPFYYPYVKGIRIINMLNYVDYNKATAMQLLEEKFGWKYYGGKHYESVFTRFFQSYYLPTKFNIDKRKIHLSALINSGQTTRNDALEQIRDVAYSEMLIEQDKQYVIKKLGLTSDEFESIIRAKPKTYMDYPNMYSVLSYGKSIMKILNKNYESRP